MSAAVRAMVRTSLGMNRRELLIALGAMVPIASQSGTRSRSTVVFDAYGTLFDVHSIVTLANELYPGQGDALSQRWRAKQLEYSWTLSLMGRYEDFWSVTGRALTFACRAARLSCTPSEHERLMNAYLTLSLFPDASAGLKRTVLIVGGAVLLPRRRR